MRRRGRSTASGAKGRARRSCRGPSAWTSGTGRSWVRSQLGPNGKRGLIRFGRWRLDPLRQPPVEQQQRQPEQQRERRRIDPLGPGLRLELLLGPLAVPPGQHPGPPSQSVTPATLAKGQSFAAHGEASVKAQKKPESEKFASGLRWSVAGRFDWWWPGAGRTGGPKFASFGMSEILKATQHPRICQTSLFAEQHWTRRVGLL